MPVVSGAAEKRGCGVSVCSFVACLSHLTIDHDSLSIRITVRTPDRRHLQHLGARYVSSVNYIKAPGLSYVLPNLAVCSRHPPPKVAIVFSLLSSSPKLLHVTFVCFPHLQRKPFFRGEGRGIVVRLTGKRRPSPGISPHRRRRARKCHRCHTRSAWRCPDVQQRKGRQPKRKIHSTSLTHQTDNKVFVF